jgi:hypothetical protein
MPDHEGGSAAVTSVRKAARRATARRFMACQTPMWCHIGRPLPRTFCAEGAASVPATEGDQEPVNEHRDRGEGAHHAGYGGSEEGVFGALVLHAAAEGAVAEPDPSRRSASAARLESQFFSTCPFRVRATPRNASANCCRKRIVRIGARSCRPLLNPGRGAESIPQGAGWMMCWRMKASARRSGRLGCQGDIAHRKLRWQVEELGVTLVRAELR